MKEYLNKMFIVLEYLTHLIEKDLVPEDSKCVIVHVDSKYEISSQAPMIKVFTSTPDPELEPIPKKRSRKQLLDLNAIREDLKEEIIIKKEPIPKKRSIKQNLKLHHSYYEPELKQEIFHTEEIIDDVDDQVSCQNQGCRNLGDQWGTCPPPHIF